MARRKAREVSASQMGAYHFWNERRNIIIMNAFKAGFKGTEIARAMGIARTTINRVKAGKRRA